MKRIVEIDFFRGLFLVVITIDHLISNDNIIIRFTKERIGWMSAAEGFVLLSGFTAGFLYTHKFTQKGEKFISQIAINRSRTIYLYHLVLFLLMVAFLYSFDYIINYWGYDYNFLLKNPFSGMLLGIFLLYQPRILDILPLYAILIIFVPLIIKSLHKFIPWIIILPSVLLYLFATLWASAAIDKKFFWINDYSSGFNILSWQFLLFSGVSLGYLFYFGRLKGIREQKGLFLVAFLLCFVLFISKNFKLTFAGIDFSYWTDRRALRPLRLINVASLTFFMAYIVARKRSWFQFKPLCYLGRYSLEVFTLHVLLVVLITPVRDHLVRLSSIDLHTSFYIYPVETIVLLMVLFLLFLAPVLFKKVKLKDLKTEVFKKHNT
jgi:hypothetical protein